ncbi:MAG: hypothetical protein M1816_002059 [Peltula sp. TS41687]|nr:MAG: hypothetical protein M1816_002059 [Peltula sp. TS41687]
MGPGSQRKLPALDQPFKKRAQSKPIDPLTSKPRGGRGNPPPRYYHSTFGHTPNLEKVPLARIMVSGNMVVGVEGSLRQAFFPIDVVPDPNCFWRAFAQAYHYDQARWAEVLSQTCQWYDLVTTRYPRHPRRDLYRALNAQATDANNPLRDLETQLGHINTETTEEMFQVVADLFSVELLVIHDQRRPANVKFNYQVMARGAHNRRQIFLVWDEGVFQALEPSLPVGKRKSEFRWTAHLKSKQAYGNRWLTPEQARCPILSTPPQPGDGPPLALEPCPIIALPDWHFVKMYIESAENWAKCKARDLEKEE